MGGAGKGPASTAPTVVSIFLRGAADGLSLVVPWREDDYFRRRPTLSLKKPDPRATDGSSCLDLDGQFALHPALAALLPSWKEGRLSVVLPAVLQVGQLELARHNAKIRDHNLEIRDRAVKEHLTQRRI